MLICFHAKRIQGPASEGKKLHASPCTFFSTIRRQKERERRTKDDKKEESKQCEGIKGENEDGDGRKDGSMQRGE